MPQSDLLRDLPLTRHILLRRDGPWLHVTLNRPEVRNALSTEMQEDLTAAFDAVRGDRGVRAIVLRGAGGNFCAGGDIKGFRDSMQASGDANAIAARNRVYGRLLAKIQSAPQPVIMLVEGGAMGGGFGLACVSDVAIATSTARFAMTEVTLGVIPAQIAPFVARRLGITNARRLAVTAGRLDATQAQAVGLVHFAVPDAAAMEAKLGEVLEDIRRTAPGAVAETKRLILATAETPIESLLDDAAQSFSRAMLEPEAKEGVAAFLEKRKPAWAQEK